MRRLLRPICWVRKHRAEAFSVDINESTRGIEARCLRCGRSRLVYITEEFD